MKFKSVSLIVVLLGLVSLLLAACGDPTATLSPTTVPATTARATTAAATTAAATTAVAATTPAATTAPATTARATTAAVATTIAATTAAPAATTKAAAGPSQEVTLLKAVQPSITATLDALKKGDLAAAKAAFQQYSDGWNGVETYVKTRSVQLYNTIQVDNGMKAAELFAKGNATVAQLQPYIEGLQKGYTEAIKMAEANPNYNPILDEVADLRILRASLNLTIEALKAGEVETAKTAFKKFDDGWYDVEQSISSRDRTLYRETEAEITRVGRDLLRTENPVVGDVIPSAEALLAKYNDGLKIVNAALTSGGAAVAKVAPISGADVDAATVKVDEFLKGKVESLIKNTATFAAAVKSRDIAKAKASYEATRFDYESIEFLAEAFTDLDVAIDARPDDFPKGEEDPTWTGFHPLEKAIYKDGKLDERTDKLAEQLVTDVATLRDEINKMKVDPAQALAGAAELIEEIQAGKITGEEERYSRTDLNDFRANLLSAKYLYQAYGPFVKQRNAALDGDISDRFSDIEKSIASYFDAQGKLTTDYSKVDDKTRKVLAQKIEGLADLFTKVGGTLGLKS